GAGLCPGLPGGGVRSQSGCSAAWQSVWKGPAGATTLPRPTMGSTGRRTTARIGRGPVSGSHFEQALLREDVPRRLGAADGTGSGSRLTGSSRFPQQVKVLAGVPSRSLGEEIDQGVIPCQLALNIPGRVKGRAQVRPRRLLVADDELTGVKRLLLLGFEDAQVVGAVDGDRQVAPRA